MRRYADKSSEAAHYIQYDQGKVFSQEAFAFFDIRFFYLD